MWLGTGEIRFDYAMNHNYMGFCGGFDGAQCAEHGLYFTSAMRVKYSHLKRFSSAGFPPRIIPSAALHCD